MSKTARTFTPKELAEEIGISPKVLRQHLRKEYARTAEAKNTSWVIPSDIAAKVRKAFEKNQATDES